MSTSVALRDLIVAGFFVVAAAVVWVEPLAEKRRARRLAAEIEDARHQADVRAARALLDREQLQAALDQGYLLADRAAEEQAHAAAEVGQGWSMPSREQYAAAAYGGTHERLLMCDADRALEVALLESHLHAQSRPPIVAEPADPDDAKYW